MSRFKIRVFGGNPQIVQWPPAGSCVQIRCENALRDYSIWYMAENLLISEKTWQRLTPDQQKIFMEVAEWMHQNCICPNFKP